MLLVNSYARVCVAIVFGMKQSTQYLNVLAVNSFLLAHYYQREQNRTELCRSLAHNRSHVCTTMQAQPFTVYHQIQL